jgi:hypothetical protein
MIVRKVMYTRRADIVAARARATIREVDETNRLRRAAKVQAHTALLAIGKMFTFGETALAAMSESERKAWHTRRQLLEGWLQRVGERGF